MFTGLVQVLGSIEQATPEGDGRAFRVEWPGLAEPIAIGESIAVNGCCLTVIRAQGSQFEVQAGPETLARTNLGNLVPGSAVNLERALRAGDRLGGHFVQGHIDTTATLTTLQESQEWPHLHFELDPQWARLVVEKGSIALDGVSLTVVSATRNAFSVMLIPHTRAVTTFGRLKPGDRVNVETDLLAKHVKRLLEFAE